MLPTETLSLNEVSLFQCSGVHLVLLAAHRKESHLVSCMSSRCCLSMPTFASIQSLHPDLFCWRSPIDESRRPPGARCSTKTEPTYVPQAGDGRKKSFCKKCPEWNGARSRSLFGIKLDFEFLARGNFVELSMTLGY